MLGSLPEFLYSIAADGLYVNIYAGSEIVRHFGELPVRITTETDQPLGGRVELRVSTPTAVEFTLRLRMPGWATSGVQISVNGEVVGAGTPASYYPLARTWQDGDRVTFTLPMGLRSTRYHGADGIPGFDRYAIEYGPLLLGVVGKLDFRGKYVQIAQDPAKPSAWMQPVPGKAGHFKVAGKPGYEFMPYYEIQDELFTCYPAFG